MGNVNLRSMVGRVGEPTAVPAPAEPAATAPAPQATLKPATRKTGSKYPPKVSFYQDREDTVILQTQVAAGSRSLSQLLHQAFMVEVTRLEQKHSDGKPFPPIGARKLPQRRAMGE